MSTDAIAFVKTLDVDNPISLLLLIFVAENTFNDSGLCRVGQEILAEDTRRSPKTVRTHLKKLEKSGVVAIKPQPRPGGGRNNDAIELVGFLDWLNKNRPHRRRKTQSEPEETSSSESFRTGRQCSGSRTGRQGSGSVYGTSRTSKSVQQNAHGGARDDVSKSNSKKEPRFDRALPLQQRLVIPSSYNDPEGTRARMVQAAGGNDPDTLKADYCQYYASKDGIHDALEHFMGWLRKIAQSRKGGRSR